MSSEIRLREETVDGVLVLSPEGNILGDMGTQMMRDRIQEALGQGVTRFIMNLEHVEFVNSMGLGVFLKIRSGIVRQKGTLLLAAPSTHVEELFRITQADQIFPIYPSIDAAIKAIGEIRS